MSAQPSRSRFITLGIYGLITTMVTLGLIFWLKISSVYCFVEYANCSPEIANAVRELKGQRFFLSDVESQVTAKLQAFPTVRIKEISKVFPNSLYITLENQAVSFAFFEPLSNETLIITDSGLALTAAAHPDWPVLVVQPQLFQEVKAAGKLDQNHYQDLTTAIHAVKFLNWPITSMYISDWQTFQVEVSEKPILLFSLTQVAEQVQRAKDVVLNLPTEEAVKAKEIDLRYKLPVLRESISIPRHDSL